MATKNYGKQIFQHGVAQPVQTLTAASTATPISSEGVTIIQDSTQAKTFQLSAPKPGLRKDIAIAQGSTAGDTTISGNGATLSGSTAISFVTGKDGGISLIGMSTSAWAVIANSGGTLS